MTIDPTRNVSDAVTRDDAPVANDFGLVVRPIHGVVPVNVDISPATVSVVTTVPANVASVTVLAANVGAIPRVASFFNDSDRFCFLKLGPAATAIDFTVKIGPAGFYEITEPGFDGIVTCIWAAGVVGAMRITELT